MSNKMSQGKLDQNSGAKLDFSGQHPNEVGNLLLFSDFKMNSNKSFSIRQGYLNLPQQRGRHKQNDQLWGMTSQSLIYPCKKRNTDPHSNCSA